MHRAAEPAASDPDLTATIRLWLDGPISEFLRAKPSGAVRADEAVRMFCSWSNVVRPERPLSSFLRKALVRAGATRDWAAIDHAEIVQRRRRIVRRGAAALGVRDDPPAGGFILRVDDFAVTDDALDAYRDFHAIAREHALPYLIAVTPFAGGDRGVSARAAEVLRSSIRDGAELALHGFTHISRPPARANELLGMPPAELDVALDRAFAHFAEHRLPKPLAFVAPFNGFDASTFGVLARRFPLVCGGPESVVNLGYRAGPSFLDGALYVPSYRGAYDVSPAGLAGLDRLAARSGDLPVAVTLHWANGVADRFAGFRRLCAHLGGRTGRWIDLMNRAHAIRASPVRP